MIKICKKMHFDGSRYGIFFQKSKKIIFCTWLKKSLIFRKIIFCTWFKKPTKIFTILEKNHFLKVIATFFILKPFNFQNVLLSLSKCKFWCKLWVKWISFCVEYTTDEDFLMFKKNKKNKNNSKKIKKFQFLIYLINKIGKKVLKKLNIYTPSRVEDRK